MAPTTVHLFPQLPYDIRYEVWKEYYSRLIHWDTQQVFKPGLWFEWTRIGFRFDPSYQPQQYCDDEICKEANIVRDIVRPIFEIPQWYNTPYYELARINWNTDYVWFPPAQPLLGLQLAFAKISLLKETPATTSSWLSNVQTLVLCSGPPRSSQYRQLPFDLFWDLRTCFESLRKVVWAVEPKFKPGDEEYTHQLHFYFMLRSMMRNYQPWGTVECTFSETSSSLIPYPQPEWSDYIQEAKELELQDFDVSETSEIEGAEQGFYHWKYEPSPIAL